MFVKKKANSRNRNFALLNANTTFQIIESYKTVRTNLLFALSTAQKKSVVVSSAEPDAGKSTTCANLAVTMAQTGARVIIIDADMRKPVQHKIFRVSNHKGLSKLLGGLESLEDSIYKNVMPNLDLITVGQIPPNPSELLGSDRMKALLETLSSTYDYVFLDTPPINIVTDSLMLSDKTAGTLLVARQKQTHYEELQKTIEMIRQVQGTLLGVVITDVSETNKPYGQYKNYRYKAYNYEYKKA